MKKRPSNRKGKARSFNGSTLQLFKRIEEGKGRCYTEAQRTAKALVRSCFRNGGGM